MSGSGISWTICKSAPRSRQITTLAPHQSVFYRPGALPATQPTASVKPALKHLHWLPVEQRITYKLCLFMHHIHTGQAPQYLSDCVSTVSSLSGRYQLRSSGSADYVLPRTRTRFGERGFSYCGPAARNTLPSDLHHITDTSTFRKRLKSVLFDRAYH